MTSIATRFFAAALAALSLSPSSGYAESVFTISNARTAVLNASSDAFNVLLGFDFSFRIDPTVDTDISYFLGVGDDPTPEPSCGVGSTCFEVSLKYFVGPGVPAIVVGGQTGRTEDFVLANPPSQTLVYGLDCLGSDGYENKTCSVPLSVRFNSRSAPLAGSGVFGVVPLPAAWVLSAAAVGALIVAGRRRDRSTPDV